MGTVRAILDTLLDREDKTRVLDETGAEIEQADRGPAITRDTGRSLHPVRFVLWILGPVVMLFGFATPHLFSVGVLLLIVQATNRWGLRSVRPTVKFIFVGALVTAALVTAEPVVGERLADMIRGVWNGATGNA